MKESEFIELLNLYVDHEITSEDAARLEAEVVSNSQRRLIYRQYCSMDKACRMLSDQYEGVAPTRGQVVQTNRWTWSSGFATAGLAAAACLTVVVIIRNHAASSPSVVNSQPQVAQVAPAAPAVALASVAPDSQLHPVLTMRTLDLDAPARSPQTLLGTNQRDPLAWISQLNMGAMPPAPVQEFNFKTQATPALLSTGMPSSQSQSLQPPAETAAFRFFYR